MSRRRKRTDSGVVEVFGFPLYILQNLRTSRTQAPYCFNGEVGFERYRVTVERIEEPVEVLVQRLVDLWETSDSIHHMQPLREAAKALGATFSTQWGCRRERSPR